MRTDGFYFGLPSKDYKEVVSRQVCIFYRNGVVLDAIGGIKDQEDPIDVVKQLSQSRMLNNSPNGWGAYLVTGSDIKISEFVPHMYCRKCEDKSITIVNDTTIIVNGYDLSKPHSVYDDTMRFIKSEKPDSTNWYFKN